MRTNVLGLDGVKMVIAAIKIQQLQGQVSPKDLAAYRGTVMCFVFALFGLGNRCSIHLSYGGAKT